MATQRTLKFDASLVATFARVRNQRVADVVREVVSTIALGAEQRTPVKTGNAKGSWQIGIAAPDLTTGVGSNGANAQKLRQIQGDLPVWVSNNVAYAMRLEKGYSKKAPTGMLRSAFDSAVAQLQSIINRVRENN